MESTRTPIVAPRPQFVLKPSNTHYRNNDLLKAVYDDDIVNVNLFSDNNYINELHNTFKVSRDAPIEEACVVLGKVIGLHDRAIKLLIVLSRLNFVGITTFMSSSFCAYYSVGIAVYYLAYRELIQKGIVYKSTNDKHRGKVLLTKKYADILVNKKRNDKFDTIVFNL